MNIKRKEITADQFAHQVIKYRRRIFNRVRLTEGDFTRLNDYTLKGISTHLQNEGLRKRPLILINSVFDGIVAPGMKLVNLNAYRTSFKGANLQGATFYSSNLRECDFVSSDLREANLSSSNIILTNFSTSNVEGTNFKESNLSFSSFRECLLNNRTSFDGSSLLEVDFRGPHFYCVNPSRVDLSDAILEDRYFQLGPVKIREELSRLTMNVDKQTIWHHKFRGNFEQFKVYGEDVHYLVDFLNTIRNS